MNACDTLRCPAARCSTGVLSLLGRDALPDAARLLENGCSSSSHDSGAEAVPTKVEPAEEQSPSVADTVGRKRTMPRIMPAAAAALDDAVEVQEQEQLRVAPRAASASNQQSDQQRLSEVRRRAFPGRPAQLTGILRGSVALAEEAALDE